MAEWLYEDGIGENRAALVERGEIVEAAIELDDGGPRVGSVLRARLTERLSPTLARVTLEGGGEAMIERAPPVLTLGASLMVEIVREALPERGRPKLPKAIPAPDAPPCDGPTLIERIAASGLPVRRCHAHDGDLLEAAGWSELLGEAESGEITFAGGALRLALTPAMALFDVDGAPPLDRLALAAAAAVARAIVRLGIGGSIGIDFPTLPDKAARQAIDAAIDAALPAPFDRTATNGFGFLQIVRRRARASLAELVQADPVGAAARAALRSAERIPPPCPAAIAVAPAVARRLAAQAGWRDELARRTGTPIAFEPLAAHG